MSKLREIQSQPDALQGALEALKRNVGAVAEAMRVLTDAFQAEGFSREEAITMALEVLRGVD